MFELSNANKTTTQLKINESIKKWHSRYPFDAYWRKKYNIPFKSPQHLAASPIDMAFEFYEEMFLKERREAKNAFKEDYKPTLFQAAGLKDLENLSLTGAELDRAFDELDITQFNDK